MRPRANSAKQIDKAIEAYFLRTYSGVQISVLDIGKIYAAGRNAIEAGEAMEPAIDAAVAALRKN